MICMSSSTEVILSPSYVLLMTNSRQSGIGEVDNRGFLIQWESGRLHFLDT